MQFRRLPWKTYTFILSGSKVVSHSIDGSLFDQTYSANSYSGIRKLGSKDVR